MQDVRFFTADNGDDLAYQINEYLMQHEYKMKLDKTDMRVVTKNSHNTFYCLAVFHPQTKPYKTIKRNGEEND